MGANDANSLQYTGRENDNTGLYFYRARYYDPQLKRFISQDPIGLVGGINVFSYVDGNPNFYVDPDGHFVGVVVAVVAVAAIAWGTWELWQNIATSAQDASKTYDLQQQQQQMIDDMMNGKPVDSNKFQDLNSQARDAQQQTLRDLEKMIKDRPPGTSANPLINKTNAVKKLICP